MAKQRPSVHKRQREHQKRQREQEKAAKAAQKRERRLNRDQQDLGAPSESDDETPGVDNGDTGPDATAV